MRVVVILLLGLGLLAPACWADEQVVLKDQKTKESYSLGYEFGASIRVQGVEVDADVLLSAVRESLTGKKPAIDTEEIRDTLRQLRKKTTALQERRFRELVTNNLKEGKVFLEENKTKARVKTLPSGLQYLVVKEGDGPTPKATNSVKVHYRGTLVNGAEFDSSYGRSEPATVKVNAMIRGWTEALQLMKTGSKWQLFIPAELGYGERQYGRIPPNSTLIFEVELLSIEKDAAPQKTEQKPARDNG